jgi:hypothetical protein
VSVLLASLILGGKVSPKPGLKKFRDDYITVTETCKAVGFIEKCHRNSGKEMSRCR